MSHPKHVLVIRLSAFGDIIRCLGTFAAIRAHHADAQITWLTLPNVAGLLDGSGYADRVWTTVRWKWWQIRQARNFTRQLREQHFDLVYDLQRNDRTALMRRLAPAALQRRWHGWDKPQDASVLDTSDISVFPLPDISWMGGNAAQFAVRAPYVLLVPGSAPQHPLKRWPAASYAALASRLVAAGITPVVIGAAAEREIAARMKAEVPALVDLTGMTRFGDIAALAQGAICTVGNDTGPMHVIALSGCPIVSLFSGQTDPAVCAPQGGKTTILREPAIADIPVDAVWNALQERKR